MSIWYEITDRADIEISDDGTELEILFATTEHGNTYVTIPIGFILDELKRLEEL